MFWSCLCLDYIQLSISIPSFTSLSAGFLLQLIGSWRTLPMGKPAATAACLREDLSFESITRSFLKDANKWRGGGERRRARCAMRHSRLLTSIRWQKGGDTIHNPHLCSLVIARAQNCNTMLATALCLARCDAGEVQFAGYKKLSFFMLPCLYYKSRSTRTQ